MRRTITWLLAAALAVAAAWWVAHLQGEVSVTVGRYAVATSTPVAVLALVTTVLAGAAVLRLVTGLLGIPGALTSWNRRHRRRLGEDAVTRALVTVAAADGPEAVRTAERARALLGDTPQTLLLAGEAARIAGDEAAAAAHYEALRARPDTRFLGLRGLIRQAQARGDFAAASSLAAEADTAYPGVAWLRAERTALAVRAGDYAQAHALAEPGPVRTQLAVAAAGSMDAGAAMKLLRRTNKEDPGFAPAALALATRLRVEGREGRAQEVLREAWARVQQPAVAEFALSPVRDKLARYRAGERFSAMAGSAAETHLLLARLALEAGLPGEAHRHADAARAGRLEPTPPVPPARRARLRRTRGPGGGPAHGGDGGSGPGLAVRGLWHRAR